MASSIVEGAGFSEDILSFLRLLRQERMRYLLVGGEAVIYHGHPRLTGDVDFFYEDSDGNVRRLFKALLEFWAGRIPGLKAPGELQEEGLILQFGRPPHRIDLMNRIDGVSFREAWPRRIRARLRTDSDLIPVLYVDLGSLLKNKRTAGRPKDLEDVRFLRAKLRQQQRRRGRA